MAEWYDYHPLTSILGGDGVRGFTDAIGITSETPELGKMSEETLKPSTDMATDIYRSAEEERRRLLGNQGIVYVNPTDITTTDINPNLYNTNVDTKIQMPDGTWRARGYDSTDATAANFTGQLTPADVIKARNVVNLASADVNTNIQANQLGDAARTALVGVGGTTVDGVTMDKGEANAVRGEALDVARSIAAAPSAAMNQFQAGQSQVVRDQLAMAERARGAERAGARRDAIIAAGQQGAQGNLAAAALSAQEEQAKRVAGASALANVRTQDTGLVTAQSQLDQARATQQAQINAQRAELQAQLDAAIAQGNTAAINAIKIKQGELDLEARKATVASDLGLAGINKDIDLGRAGFTQQTELFNAGAGNTSQTQYKDGVKDLTLAAQQGTTTVSVGNAERDTGAKKDLTDAQNKLIEQSTGLEGQGAITSKQLEVGQETGNKDRTVGIVTTNKKADDTESIQEAANDLTADSTNAGNALTDKSITNTGVKGALDSGTSAAGVVAGNERTTVGAKTSEADIDQKQDAAVTGAVATGVAAGAKSDERLKEDIYAVGGSSGSGRFHAAANSPDDIYAAASKDTPHTLATESDRKAIAKMTPEDRRKFAESVDEIVYRFKPGTGMEDEGLKIGTGAGSLASLGPLGRAMVYDTANGDEVDYNALTLNLGKTAVDTSIETMARLDALEKKLKMGGKR